MGSQEVNVSCGFVLQVLTEFCLFNLAKSADSKGNVNIMETLIDCAGFQKACVGMLSVIPR